MKKILSLLLCTVMVLTLLGSAFAEETPVVLKYTGWLENNQEALEAVAALYTAQHPNVTFEFEIMDTDQYDTVIMARLATGESGDIIATRYELQHKQNYAAGNYVVDLSDMDELRSNMKPGMDVKCEYDGTIQGFPVAADVWGLWYNEDMFAELGYDEFPDTYQGLLDVCQKALDAGYLPIANGLQEGWTAWMLLWSGLFGDVGEENPDFFNESQTGEKTFADNAKLIKALNRFNELYTLGYLPENYLGVSQDVAVQEFFSGNALFCPSGSWYMADILAANCEFEVGFEKLPYSDEPQDDFCAQGGISFCLSVASSSKNIEVAKDFENFFFQPENYAVYCEIAQVTGPTVNDVDVSFNSLATKIADAITSMNTSLYPVSAANELHEGIQALLAGHMTAEEIAAEMDAAVEKSLGK